MPSVNVTVPRGPQRDSQSVFRYISRFYDVFYHDNTNYRGKKMTKNSIVKNGQNT